MVSEQQSTHTDTGQPIRDEKGRFLPGCTGNPGGLPGGRPRGSSMMAEIERQLAAEADDGRTHQERVVAKLIELAEEGDTRAAELILRRVAPEKLLLESNGIPLVVLRSFTGFRDAPPALPEDTPDAEGPVLEIESGIPADAETLADGRVRFRI